MDSSGGAQQVGMEFNMNILKEPRGFLRFLQLIFSIFAFATTSGFGTHFSYKLKDCNGTVNQEYSYPFRINQIYLTNCDGEDHRLIGDFSSQSQYFVASGVLAFLYCLASLAVYLLYDRLYRGNQLVPMIDFGFTLLMAVFWLTSSAAWSQGVADLKYFANPEIFFKWCAHYKTDGCVDDVFSGSFSTVNVSLIFGYLNFALWAANLWFLFKETPWFLSRTEKPAENH